MPQRKNIRLKDYDYTSEGSYFITICTNKMVQRFGYIEQGEMVLNDYGIIARDKWADLPNRFKNIGIAIFEIMPNHMHGIISITCMDDHSSATIGNIIGAYKSIVSTSCLAIYKSKEENMGKLWQRNYFEHIIRNESSYHFIADYIINNPANWRKINFIPQRRGDAHGRLRQYTINVGASLAVALPNMGYTGIITWQLY